MVEEHLHQVLEYELFLHEAGWAQMSRFMDENLPWGLRTMVKSYMRGHFRKQLHARGVARHSPEEIAAMGRADLDALEVLIGEGPYLFGGRPCTFDASVFGLVAPLVYVPADAPVMQHASSLPAVRAYCERIMQKWFDADASEDATASAA